MGRILGLDLGVNSIGWAIIDTNSHKIIECGVKTLPTSQTRRIKREEQTRGNRLFLRTLTLLKSKKIQKRATSILMTLIVGLIITISLVLINNSNWQYWLNLSIMILLTLSTLLYKDKNGGR